jgi:ribonuclease HI
MNSPVQTCRQYRLLINGSRDASPALLRLARQAVERARAHGWLVLVGDNPRGVDAAVIDACDALGVNVLVFGVAPRPRKGSQRPETYWQVDVSRREEEDFGLLAAYATRDRYMIDLADRVLALWDGTSRGTKAGYDYAVKSGKPADLRIIRPAEKPIPSTPRQNRPRQSAAPSPHTVELVVDGREVDGDAAFEAIYGLRALDDRGNVLYAIRQTLRTEVHTSDAARMQALIAALERLKSRLKSESAHYRLRIGQSSANVEGWLAHGWRRNVLEVQRLAGQIDLRLKAFPDVAWVKMPRPQVRSSLDQIGAGERSAR